MGINDLINFDFMDPPPVQTLIAAMEQLYYLGSLDDEGLLTKLGRRMAEFPLEPQLSKMLLTSVDLGSSDEIITIVSMLSVQNIFYRPRDKQALADQKRSKFYHPDGDHLTLLNVYEMWKANKCSNAWCYDNFIQSRALRKAQDIRKQLIAIMERYKLEVCSCNKDYARVRKSISAGFFAHVARKDPKEGYKTLIDNQTIFIHPSSALFNKSPEWVVYHELVLTSKEYMREVTAIEAKWLTECAGRFFKQCDPNILSKRKRNEKLDPLHNKYEDPNAWRLSKRRGLIY
jgi:ATP-dependent RNA helicase DHX8/PRP22